MSALVKRRRMGSNYGNKFKQGLVGKAEPMSKVTQEIARNVEKDQSGNVTCPHCKYVIRSPAPGRIICMGSGCLKPLYVTEKQAPAYGSYR